MSQLKMRPAAAFRPVYANSTSPFDPELWANESLAILEENMVAASLVHRDFEPVISKFGSVVHTRRPGQFTAKRKLTTDQVTVQDATATDVMVPLNQQVHVSFLITDGEESKSFKDLVQTYLAPAMLAQARYVDQMVLGQYFRFLANGYGGLGQLSGSNARQYILGTRQVMNQNKAYMDGRNLILTPASEASMLNLDLFTAAYAVGDAGEALKKAYLGQKLGFDMFMCQNAAFVNPGSSTLAGAINLSAGYAAGATVLTVNGFTGAVGVGDWVVIAGDNFPHRITAHTETLGNTTSITLSEGLKNAVANAAVVTAYVSGGTVSHGGGYSGGTGTTIGYSGELTVTGVSVAPQIGQIVSFGTSLTDPVYSVIGTTSTTGITLDRPLEANVADSAVVHFGPPGAYNMAFHRNALALVVRPLSQPMAGAGALSAVVNHNSLSMRVTITYQGKDQGHLVTLDMLCGIALLDSNLGAVLLG